MRTPQRSSSNSDKTRSHARNEEALVGYRKPRRELTVAAAAARARVASAAARSMARSHVPVMITRDMAVHGGY